MDSWAIVFLGVVALGSLAQIVFMIWLVRELLRLSRGLQDLQHRVDREITPILQELSRVTRNLSEVSDLAVLEARRLDDLVVDTIERVEDTGRLLRRIALRPLRPLGHAAAFLKGLRRGFDVYRQLSAIERPPGRIARHDGEDEHLFI